ncbi:hypothetical protein MBOT_32080 [Mycobacterium botniense]|uniref:Uncharacterized protein n=1 Tax=Mycobacterium botniense TaxID=84962 RepID=A0A7I9Y1U5_9MYCO|nr:hypothetical protein MBOT_32080 [Mycobacterium botniense]
MHGALAEQRQDGRANITTAPAATGGRPAPGTAGAWAEVESETGAGPETKAGAGPQVNIPPGAGGAMAVRRRRVAGMFFRPGNLLPRHLFARSFLWGGPVLPGWPSGARRGARGEPGTRVMAGAGVMRAAVSGFPIGFGSDALLIGLPVDPAVVRRWYFTHGRLPQPQHTCDMKRYIY